MTFLAQAVEVPVREGLARSVSDLPYSTPMKTRWLTVPIVMGAILTATSAGAWVHDSTVRDDRVYARHIAEASARYAVPERLVWAVIRVESGFDHRAVSPRGARGLMQLMPQTAALLGVRDCFNPRENIDGGTRHLQAMLVRFHYDVRLAVAAYNAGEKPVLTYRGVPPYRETREYVAQVLELYQAPAEPRLSGAVQRIVQTDGTVLYTNVRFGHIASR
jgi:soluble lytic murein transglycosylase-like protein